MKITTRVRPLNFSCRILITLSIVVCSFSSSGYANGNYDQLVNLYNKWREFEKPPFHRGAPDYRKITFQKRNVEFDRIVNSLNQIDYTGWPVEKKVDWYILFAELNGYDFNNRVLKPWARDPAFYKTIWTYQSDVPAHEGPTHHATTELWTYNFPLSKKQQRRLIADLQIIAPLNEQAKINLVGNARELWIAGIRDIKQQSANLDRIGQLVGTDINGEFKQTLQNAKKSTLNFVTWLEKESESKNGSSGIGKDNYNWYLKNVHLVPLTWDDEVSLLKRELDRAWSSLKLEEHRNRNLPKLTAATTSEEYQKLADEKVEQFLAFLKNQDIVTVADYFEPTLMAHKGNFVPAEKRNFFTIGSHFDPTPLYSHFYHWFELARTKASPPKSKLRRLPLLYNIFDSRNEGTATAVEEMFMHAGLYDKNPRVREIVWIMIAQRAARGLGSLYAHANQMSMKQAGKVHSEWTPRGWMKTEPELLIFEQHLYLRQPGYGTSYITGKYLLERTMADYAKLMEDKGKPFLLKNFFDELNTIGNIPISLGRWQMTGLSDEIDQIIKNYQAIE